MNRSLLFIVAAVTAAMPATATPAPSKEPAAIVYALTGEAFQGTLGQRRHPILLFDRLPAGADLEVAPNARLALAFASGKRWSLGGARSSPRAQDLKTRAVALALPPPPLPLLAPSVDAHAACRRRRTHRATDQFSTPAARGGDVERDLSPVSCCRRPAISRSRQDGKVSRLRGGTDESRSFCHGSPHPGAPYHWICGQWAGLWGTPRGEAVFTTRIGSRHGGARGARAAPYAGATAS